MGPRTKPLPAPPVIGAPHGAAARAWTAGMLGFEGDFEALLAARRGLEPIALSRLDRARLAAVAVRLAGRCVLRPPPVPASEARPRGRVHSLGRDRQAISHHYDISNRFYCCCSDRAWCTRARSSPPPRTRWRRPRSASSRRSAPSSGSSPASGCSTSVAAGARCCCTRCAATACGASASRCQTRRPPWRAPGCARPGCLTTHVRARRALPLPRVRPQRALAAATGRPLSQRRRGPSLLALLARRHVHQPLRVPGRRATAAERSDRGLEQAGVEPRAVESWREHYARTLRCWHENLIAHRAEMEAEVGPERMRVWDLYTLACALAFDGGEITNYQVLAERS